MKNLVENECRMAISAVCKKIENLNNDSIRFYIF